MLSINNLIMTAKAYDNSASLIKRIIFIVPDPCGTRNSMHIGFAFDIAR